MRKATKTPMTTLEKLKAQGTQMGETVDAMLSVFKEKAAVGKSSHELSPDRWGNLKSIGSQLSDATEIELFSQQTRRYHHKRIILCCGDSSQQQLLKGL